MNIIYSYINKNMKLWNKVTDSNYKINEIILDYITLKTKEKKKNELVDKNFILTDSKLFYTKNKKVKGFIILEFIGFNYSDEKLSISLFNNFKYFEIFFEKKENFSTWKKFFITNGISNNFNKEFEILDKIGEGGNSSVYKVRSNFNKKIYALKSISKHKLLNDKYGLDSLTNELRIMKKMKHKNIVKYKKMFETETTFNLIIEYCNYYNLGQLLKLNEKINKENIITQLLQGVKYLHQLNIVHRDLKPENIFLNLDMNKEIIVKIGDFGLSNDINKKFIFKKCGTPGYIAPEILKYNSKEEYKITLNVDIYSIGHLIYNIYTKTTLFHYEDLKDLLKLNKYNNYKLCVKFNELNTKFQNLVKDCLEDEKYRINIFSLEKTFNSIITN